MEDNRFEALAVKSRAVHGHKDVLPVACWLLEEESASVKPPELTRGLDGRHQSGQIIKALLRLAGIGAVRELPRLPAPNARHFEVVIDHPYWLFASAMVRAVDGELAMDRA